MIGYIMKNELENGEEGIGRGLILIFRNLPGEKGKPE
jgi:hypothetical protein